MSRPRTPRNLRNDPEAPPGKLETTTASGQIHGSSTTVLFENLLRDSKLALRGFRRQPTFTATVIITLALGLGANTAVFSVVDAIVLRPLPVPQPNSVIAIDTLASRLTRFGNSSYLDYQDLTTRSKSFESLNVFQPMVVGLNPEPGKAGERAEATYGLLVSANFFSSFHVQPALGRAFRSDEGGTAARDPVVILSYGLWKRVFGGDAGILGRQVKLNGHLSTVVGVAPRSFTGPDIFLRPDLYVPTGMAGIVARGGAGVLTNRSMRGFRMRGRLRPGVTLAQAQSELDSIMQALEREHPDSNKDTLAVLRWELRRRFMQNPSVPVILTALVVLIILITSANVANLLLARASSRLRDIATQLSIGASRSRLLMQFMTESALLAVAGGAAGVLLGYVAVRGIASFLLDIPFAPGPELRLDARVFFYAAAVSCGTVLLYGVAPALAAIREGWKTVVRTSVLASAEGVGGSYLRRSLIGAQVALGSLLLVVGALFLKSFERAQALDLGFSPDHLLLVTLDPSLDGYSKDKIDRFYRTLLREVAVRPGIKATSLAAHVPFIGGESWDLSIDGYMAPRGEKWLDVETNRVSPGYFSTMRIPFVEGRDFTERDIPPAPSVAVVNEKFVRQYLAPQGDVLKALGRILRLRDAVPIQIIGVVKDSAVYEIGAPPPPMFYLSAFQYPAAAMTLHLRYTSDFGAVAGSVRKIVQSMDPELAPLSVTNMSSTITDHALFVPRVLTILSVAFALIALALAAVGLYGVMAFMVGRRTQEIGIRMALGAEQGRVLWMVMKSGLVVVSVGLLIGCCAALLCTPLLAGMLAGIDPHDPAVFVPTVVLLLSVGALATWVPARRATRIDPMSALRYE